MLEGGKAGKDMFDKGELAAILRFGAENLFEEENGDTAKEDVQQRDKQLYEEDIDAILARAEVVDQRVEEEANEKKNDLLSAFNSVATFKNDEDDATFWNRLITDDQRAKVPERKKKGSAADAGLDSELMPRTARLQARGTGGDDKGESTAPCLSLCCVHTLAVTKCFQCNGNGILCQSGASHMSYVETLPSGLLLWWRLTESLTCGLDERRPESKEPSCGGSGCACRDDRGQHVAASVQFGG